VNALLYIQENESDGIRCYREQEGNGACPFTFAPFNGDLFTFSMNEVEMVKPEAFAFSDKIPYTASKTEHINLVAKTVGAIQANHWGKVVVARAEQVAESLDVWTVFLKLCQTYPKATVYLFSSEETGTWMGATPELLVRIKGQELETMSLAGTRKKGEEESFTDKEVAEQSMVTDYIRQLLRKQAGVESVKVSKPELSEAGNLVHYKSRIKTNLKEDFDQAALLKALHPTPAVAGLPKQEALDFLREHEKLDRSFYSGYFGLRSERAATYYVNLRCLQLFKNSYALYAGGGITRDSDPASEWEETVAKMDTLRNVIRRF
jgi:isochorismate synthase